MHRADQLIWIAWQEHRRSRELAAALGASLFTILRGGKYLTRITILSLRTVALLLRLRPGRVIVQNPSMVLASIVCFLKPLFHFKVIVDRHSNFKFETSTSKDLKYRVFHYLSRYTVRRADLTIVTNSYLKRLVQMWDGRGFVLQDKIPGLYRSRPGLRRLSGEQNIVCICSFSGDEPIDEILQAAGRLDGSLAIYMTGNSREYLRRSQQQLPPNVVFTGFLPESDFISLVVSADAVMALTTKEHILLCGAYEALAAGKPLILSNTSALREYFGDGPVYTENKAAGIAEAIQSVIENRAAIAANISDLRKELFAAWTLKFDDILALIRNL